MTQMGLDYAKFNESKRHNLADEGIRSRATDISEREADTHSRQADIASRQADIASREADTRAREADTHAYSASFEPQRIANAAKSAEGALLKGKSSVISAEAQKSQAETSARRFSPDLLERSMKATESEALSKASQAATSQFEAENRNFFNSLSQMDPATAAFYAGQRLGMSPAEYGSAAFVQSLQSWLRSIPRGLVN